MISFKQFFNESNSNNSSGGVAASKRKGLTHLRNMKPYQFVEWLYSVKKEAKGLLGSHNVSASLKVDGLGWRFGKDQNGRPFVEGSRTGPQTEPGVFSSYAKSKNPDNIEVIARSKQYDDLLVLFTRSSKTKKLRAVLPPDTKVIGELFYTPMAEMEDETGIKFVTIKYDRKKIGSLATFVVFDIVKASDGSPHPEKKKIISDLKSVSTKEIKVDTPDVSFSDTIDINAEISLLGTLLDDVNETIRLIKSRKKVDKEAKVNILKVVDNVKHKLEDKIRFNPAFCGADKFCDIEKGEGLVLDVGGGFDQLKVINPEFEIAHHGGIAGSGDSNAVPVSIMTGRFQPFHLGHRKIIDQMSHRPIVLLVKGKGSSQDKKSNPFDEDYQQYLIKKVFPGIEIRVVNNSNLIPIIYHIEKTGENKVREIMAGSDRVSSYEKQISKKYPDVSVSEIKRSDEDISATKIRNALKDNDPVTFKKMMPVELHSEFDEMRQRMGVAST